VNEGMSYVFTSKGVTDLYKTKICFHGNRPFHREVRVAFQCLMVKWTARAGLVFSVTKEGVVKAMPTNTMSTDACGELFNYR